jgi:hypothetical protein
MIKLGGLKEALRLLKDSDEIMIWEALVALESIRV